MNGIVSDLAADERISSLYDLWYEQREEVIRTYPGTAGCGTPGSCHVFLIEIANIDADTVMMLWAWLFVPDRFQPRLVFNNLLIKLIVPREGNREVWNSFRLCKFIEYFQIKHIRKSVRKEIFDYLHSLPLNIDIEVNGQPYILVHDGAIAAYHNYMYRYDNQEEYAVWNRIYYNEPDIEGKIIIFGHTPTSEYQHNNPLEIWRSPSGGKIGIDCGCGFPHSLSQGRYPAYGRLACLRLDDMKVFYSEEDIPEEVEEIVW